MRGNIRKYLFTFISEISGDRGSDWSWKERISQADWYLRAWQ